MIAKFLKSIFGDKTQKDIKVIKPLVDKTKEEFEKLANISNDELRNKTEILKREVAEYIKVEENRVTEIESEINSNNDLSIEEKEQLFEEKEKLQEEIDKKIEEVLLDILPQAFAVVKETARRFAENEHVEVTANEFDKTIASKGDYVEIENDKAFWYNSWDAAGAEIVWNMVHYDVQLIGGIALHQGKVAEMQTGEGKTLVATLPVYLNSLAKKGVHLVTVNDYLARRDCEWMGPIFEFHGFTIDCIDRYQPNSPERKQAYMADITYGTNNEFGFDYLRDNMASSIDGLVQKKHHFAIIDEVDSVLIDDARTPLIISGPIPKGNEHEYKALKPKIEKLVQAQRKLTNAYLSEAQSKLKFLDDETSDKKIAKQNITEGNLSLLRAYRGMPKNRTLIEYLSQTGIRTQLQKTENHYLQDQAKEMIKVDKELFFVIDEKNNSIDLTDKGIELLSQGEDPSYYIMTDLGDSYAELDKMNLSEDEARRKKDEIIRDYTIKAERIHSLNQLLKAYTLFEKDVEYVVMDGKVKIVDEQTGRIMDGRRYSDGLHQAIEAKESVKVEDATQTYATITLQNYFRMYHKLAGMTGTAETESQELWDIYKLDVMVIPTNRPIQRDDRQDLVYKTEREKFYAVIDEIQDLIDQDRPVLVGTTSVEVSEKLSALLSKKGIKHNVLNAKLHQKEAEVVAEAGKPRTVTIATNMAGRGTDIKLGEGVKEAGGLAIIGTERHDSRRVDRQLRGRSGRQGDTGSSQFFVSLEDNLMRLFNSERISKMMDRLGFKEGEVIQHSMITKSIERAQKKVEENNFGVRKHLLEYDDVLSSQRNAIYVKRKNALYGDKLDLDIDNMIYETIELTVNTNKEYEDYANFEFDLLRHLAIESPVSESEFESLNEQQIIEKVYEVVIENYQRKKDAITNQVYPVIETVYNQEESNYDNIVIPFTDGLKELRLVVNLEDAYNSKGKAVTKELEKNLTLAIIDNEWKEHLREMDNLRQSVRNSHLEQKDPLLIYKFESFELFKQMVDRVNQEVLSFLFKASLPVESNVNVSQAPKQQQDNLAGTQTSRDDIAASTKNNQEVASQQQGQAIKKKPVTVGKQYGRNEKVKVVNLRSGETKELKFKQAEPLVNQGTWQLVEE